jgi:hypothetical protein
MSCKLTKNLNEWIKLKRIENKYFKLRDFKIYEIIINIMIV